MDTARYPYKKIKKKNQSTVDILFPRFFPSLQWISMSPRIVKIAKRAPRQQNHFRQQNPETYETDGTK